MDVAADHQEGLLRQQQALARFGELALRSQNLDEILHQACRLIGDALGTELAKVMELQEDGTTLLARAGVGWPAGVVGRVRVDAGDATSEGHAIRTGKPVVSANIDTETRFDYPRFVRDAGVKALVNVPIMGAGGEKPYGILQVDSRVPREFTGTDVNFLRGYANLLAAAVARLRLLVETRQANTALQDSEARLSALLSASSEVLYSMNADWTEMRQLTGDGFLADTRSPNPFWLADYIPKDEQARFMATVSRAVRDKDVFSLEHRVRLANGSIGWVQSRAVPLFGPDGETTEWFGAASDVTVRREARDTLQQLNRMLEQQVAERTVELERAATSLGQEVAERERVEERLRQSEKLKAIGQLTGGIAHDFNNMLQAIFSCLSMVRHRMQQGRLAEVPGYVERAEKSAKRAALLTHRLLAFGRQQTLAPEPVNFDRIARGMEDMVRGTVGPGVQVELKLANGKWLAMCDPNQMESALLNLCVNARDAMPDGGWLVITTEELTLSAADVAGHEDAGPGRYTAIAVSDTGMGMTPEVAAHVFEPFFTTKPLGQGTGLGLSQIYGFVRQSGGIVQLETAPGKGTTVRLCLPFHMLNPENQATVPPDNGRTVLLVEDEQDVREMTAEQLRELGYRVLEAENGAAALRLVHAGTQLDLLISDVGLPGDLNGRQVADATHKRHPDLPVILITGYAAGQEVSGLDVVTKPFNPQVLADLVQAKIRPLPPGGWPSPG